MVERLDLMFMGDSTDENIRLEDYDPDGDHAWRMIEHDDQTGVLTMSTAPHCGEWTPRVSAVLDTPMQPLSIELYQELNAGIGEPGTSDAPGWYGQLYITDTDPEPEEESES